MAEWDLHRKTDKTQKRANPLISPYVYRVKLSHVDIDARSNIIRQTHNMVNNLFIVGLNFAFNITFM